MSKVVFLILDVVRNVCICVLGQIASIIHFSEINWSILLSSVAITVILTTCTDVVKLIDHVKDKSTEDDYLDTN